MRVVTGKEMADLDRQAIGEFGMPGPVLMETAGRAVFREARQSWPQARRWSLLCGPGNNGGDGFVIARTLLQSGGSVRVGLLGSASRLQGDALLNYELLLRSGARVEELQPEGVEDLLAEGELVVDALFGTGLTRPLEGLSRQVVEQVNGASRPVVAVDIPSGVCAETGQVLGAAVRADLTVTMGLPKRGMLLYPGAERTGRLVVAEIGLPASLLSAAGKGQVLTARFLRQRLPQRAPTSHKGSCGHALLVAGSDRYPGAAGLAAEACLRAGAGLVTLATSPVVRGLVAARLRETLSVALHGACLAAPDLETLRELARGKTACCLGPGLGLDDSGGEVVRRLAAELEGPVVLDADALRAVAGGGRLGVHVVLTPHPGELSALTGRSVGELERDRIQSALQGAAQYGCVLVFKGAPTVVADPQGRFWVNPTGSPVLSQGGTGDVLAGAIAGLMAQGCSALDAALAGVFLHGYAGRIAARRSGPRGVLAGEIARNLPRALARVLEGRGPNGPRVLL